MKHKQKKDPKKGPKNVSIFATFLVSKTQQKQDTLLTRSDVDVTTTAIGTPTNFRGGTDGKNGT